MTARVLFGGPYLFFFTATLLGNSTLFLPRPAAGLCDGWGQQFIYSAFTVERCLTEGRDPNARNPKNGETPLMGAALIGDAAAVQMLLAAGARVETQDKAGMTARDWAKRFDRTAILELLAAAPEAGTI